MSNKASAERRIIWLGVDVNDPLLIGGKGHGLQRLLDAGIRVPAGFVVSTSAFNEAVPTPVLQEAQRLVAALGLDPSIEELERAAALARHNLWEATDGHPVLADIGAAYEEMCIRCGVEVGVAIRSSSVGEDAAAQSFAGQQDSYLWVTGRSDVVDAVRHCWTSLFTARALQYRRDSSTAMNDTMAVVVQEMVPAKAAGVLMTLNPINGDRSKVAIESVWGLGELMVSGEVNPDRFLIDKVTGDAVERAIVTKPTRIVRDPRGGTTVEEVQLKDQNRPSLTDAEIAELLGLARLVERHAGTPQDAEFAIGGDGGSDAVYLVQLRPETTWSLRPVPTVRRADSALDAVLATLTGTPSNPDRPSLKSASTKGLQEVDDAQK